MKPTSPRTRHSREGLFLLLLCSVSLPCFSQDTTFVPTGQSTTQIVDHQTRLSIEQTLTPLEQILNPDGSVQLDGEFRGALDVSGWQMGTGSDGKPRFLPSAGLSDILLAEGGVPEDSLWDGRFGPPGMNSDVNALAVIPNGAGGTDLYAGGVFTTAGGDSANYIARWNGTSWTALGSGMNSNVYAFAVIGADLSVGGLFTSAGEKPSAYIGQWHIQGIVGVTEPAPPLPAGHALRQNYPNPFNPTTIIAYELPASSRVTLSVFDVLGRKIQDLVSENQAAGNHQIEFSATGLASGVYLYRLTAGTYTDTKKLLVLR